MSPFHILLLRKKYQKDKQERSLLEDIEKLKSNPHFNFALVSEQKLELESLREEKLPGHVIRSRAKWVEEGKTPTKCSLLSSLFYFFGEI